MVQVIVFFFFFQAEDGIRDLYVTGVQTCALPISDARRDLPRLRARGGRARRGADLGALLLRHARLARRAGEGGGGVGSGRGRPDGPPARPRRRRARAQTARVGARPARVARARAGGGDGGGRSEARGGARPRGRVGMARAHPAAAGELMAKPAAPTPRWTAPRAGVITHLFSESPAHMKNLTAAQIRDAFLRFFEARGHRRVPSSSLVPQNDPTLLFTNAGMVQFKDVFTGRERREYRRATSSQKCVRAGGKHNDLENVGFTARHHTFFEMLGNFSFGDYFKKDAIAWAWELVTSPEWLAIPRERLAATVFAGEGGIPWDEEAYELWKAQGVPEGRILKLGAKDNFWAMGETGPCGPCSELHYFQGNDIACAEEKAGRTCQGVACDCDRWLEIWNLVFMQFERSQEGGLTPLPKPSIDTGAGLERIAAVVQGKRSNYDTDLFQRIIEAIAKVSGKRYGANGDDDVSMRVIADHARATAFLVGDGVLPSNEGRGYVLRRIMRRAIRHGKRLGLEKLFLAGVCGALIDEMGSAYPELREHRHFVEKVALTEEESFRRTLDKGLAILEEEVERLVEAGEKMIPGKVAFQLYDTFGFPMDLTSTIAAERAFEVDELGFDKAMLELRARSARKCSRYPSAVAL